MDALIARLDALAQRCAHPRPEALRLLRLYGARHRRGPGSGTSTGA